MRFTSGHDLAGSPISDDYIITFGKYNGCKISELPTSYLNYLYNNPKTNNAIWSYLITRKWQSPKPLEGKKTINTMAIIANSNGSGKDFQPVEAGSYTARCYSMIHIGTIMGEYQGKPKEQNKVRLTFELPTEMKVFKEGDIEKPQIIGKDFTLSMHEKAVLRKFLNSWRGKAFSEEEAKSFDITKLLGTPCTLGIAHKTGKNGNVYAEITSVSKVMKGMDIPAQFNTSFEFSVLEFDQAKFEALPEFIAKQVKESSEYLAMIGTPKPEVISAATMQQQDDDLPF